MRERIYFLPLLSITHHLGNMMKPSEDKTKRLTITGFEITQYKPEGSDVTYFLDRRELSRYNKSKKNPFTLAMFDIWIAQKRDTSTMEEDRVHMGSKYTLAEFTPEFTLNYIGRQAKVDSLNK